MRKSLQELSTDIKNAYTLKQEVFEKSQTQLRKKYGEKLILDTIDERTRDAYQQQWLPTLKEKNSGFSHRYMHRKFKKDAIDHFPSMGFKDSFNETARVLGNTQFTHNEFNPARLDLSIWFNQILCGIVFSNKPSPDARGATSVGIVEAHPHPMHPLKGHIMEITDHVSQNYARALDHKIVVYSPPYSQGAIKVFSKIGIQKSPVMLNSTPYGVEYAKPYYDRYTREL